MTDPGDMAHTDSNERSDLPEATPERITPTTGGEGRDGIRQDIQKEEGERASRTPDPLAL